MKNVAIKTKNDISALNDYIENSIIPNYVKIHKGNQYIFSSALRKREFDDEQMSYIIKYLNKCGIEVRGEDGVFVKNNCKELLPKTLTKEENRTLLNTYTKVKSLKSKTNDLKEMQKLNDKEIQIRNIIVEGNIKFARFMSYKFKAYYKIPYEEIESTAYCALIKSVETFDISHDTSFTTYCAKIIYTEIVRYIKDYYNLEPKVLKILNGFDLEDNSNIKGDIFNDLVNSKIAVYCPKSLDELMQHYDLVDNNDYEKNANNNNLNKKINVILKILNEKERFVIINYFGFTGKKMTYDEIGKLLHVTHQRIHLLLKGALAKLNNYYKDELQDLLSNEFNYQDNNVYEIHEKVNMLGK